MYERRRASDTQRGIPQDWSEAFEEAVDLCDEKLKASLPKLSPSTPSIENRDSWLIRAAKDLLSNSASSLDAPLTFIFVAAQLSLSSLSLKQRALRPFPFSSNLKEYLVSNFYPRIFRYLALHLNNPHFLPDLDGSVFLAFLTCSTNSPKSTLEMLVGSRLAHNVTSVWTSGNLSVPDLGILALRYPPPSGSGKAQKFKSKFTLLPFSHPVFDDYLPSINTDNVQGSSTPRTRTRIEKLCDEPFVDETHWHNAKSILPKHLGGKNDTTTSTPAWEKMKQLRRDQRFMANRKTVASRYMTEC